MTIYFARSYGIAALNDYGTEIQIKCHKPVTRRHQTQNGQKCVNWKTLDSFVEPYDKLPGVFGNLYRKTLIDRNPYRNYVNPETIGITWNDSYCRSITDSLATGCFVARSNSSISNSEMVDNCSGLGFKDFCHSMNSIVQCNLHYASATCG